MKGVQKQLPERPCSAAAAFRSRFALTRRRARNEHQEVNVIIHPRRGRPLQHPGARGTGFLRLVQGHVEDGVRRFKAGLHLLRRDRKRGADVVEPVGRSVFREHFPNEDLDAEKIVIPITRMIFGINATKTAVIIAETKGAGDTFAITTIRSIPFQVRSGGDLTELLQCLTTVFHRGGRRASATVALLKCSSGRFGSCLEAIKGEAMTELAAFQKGLRVIKVAPQCLKKTLGCAAGQKWRDRAAELFNPDGKLRNWSKGAAGAVSVAFKAAGD